MYTACRRNSYRQIESSRLCHTSVHICTYTFKLTVTGVVADAEVAAGLEAAGEVVEGWAAEGAGKVVVGEGWVAEG